MSFIELNIHPDAAINFNNNALSLLELCKESRYNFAGPKPKSSFPEPYIAAQITDKDIESIGYLGMKNSVGESVAKYFTYKGKQVGLEGDDYKKLVKLCEAIQKAIKPTSTISRDVIEVQAFEWLDNRYSGNTTNDLIEYILPKLTAEIKEFEVCVPIGELIIQSPMTIGRIELRPITKELLDQWKAPMLEKGTETNIQFNNDFFEEKMRKPYQGMPGAFMKLQAEPIAAQEIALYQTERSLAMLRVFTPAALIPEMSCHIAIRGGENMETVTAIRFHNGMFVGLFKDIADKSARPLAIDNNMIAHMYASGLATVSRLLSKNDITKFEQTLLDALTLYSHATRERELASKVIYILAALEGIFLKNDTEPIQQNLRERIATILGKTLSQKKEIIRNINTIYGTRSAFLHHAQTINQIEELGRFMYFAFMSLTTAIQNHDRFPSSQEFIAAIDDLKLTGATPPS